MKIILNTCGKDLGGEMECVYENHFKSSLENSKSHSLLEKFV